MKRTLLAMGLVSSLGALPVGCAGSETGNGARPRTKLPVSIEMRLLSPGALLTMLDSGGTAFTIDSAIASVQRIEFVMPAGDECEGLSDVVLPYSAACGLDDRMRIDGPWVVDLVSGDFQPPLEGVDVLGGVFDRIEMKLAPGEAGVGGVGAGDALDGATLDVDGSVALGAETRPFGLTLAINVQSRFEDAGAVVIGEDADAVQLTLDVGNWFSTIDLGACIAQGSVPSSDGVLRLESAPREVCGDVARAVRQALSLTGRVRVQENGAGGASSSRANGPK